MADDGERLIVYRKRLDSAPEAMTALLAQTLRVLLEHVERRSASTLTPT